MMYLFNAIKAYFRPPSPPRIDPATVTTSDRYAAWIATLPKYGDQTKDQKDLAASTLLQLSQQEQLKYRNIGRAKFFAPENRKPYTEELSPSGRYKLVISSYSTGPGTWSYSRGEVYRTSDNVLIGDIQRNYSRFPYCWMEEHKDGHDYLVGGESYQGQTFIQLDTGERRDYFPESGYKGFGFCWSGMEFLKDGITLEVDGCYWACPYQIKFFDVSDPMNKGWEELELPDEVWDFDPDKERSQMTYSSDGLITYTHGERIFKATGERYRDIEIKQMALYRVWEKDKSEANMAARDAHELAYPESDTEEGKDAWDLSLDYTAVLRREGNKMVLVSETKSPYLLEQERLAAKAHVAETLKLTGWRESSPLWLKLAEHFPLPFELQSLTGWMYPSRNDRDAGCPNPQLSSGSVSTERVSPTTKRRSSGA
jgi:hypothetical protein